MSYDLQEQEQLDALKTWWRAHSNRVTTAATAVLLDEKSYDQALQVLNVDVPDAFASEFADRRGDVYAAQGKVAEARAAYSEALAKAGTQPLRSLIQMKLDALPPPDRT